MNGGLLRALSAVLVVFLLFCAGCATLPATRPLAELQQQQAVTLFRETMAHQGACPCCIDAQVRVSLKSFVQNGTISGFLQAKAPSFLKFTGLNPLGQPMMFLTTDGGSFRYIAVPEAKGYEGPVTAAAFKKYAPPGFDPGRGFYWLAGRLAPEKLRIFSVAADPEGHGFWLELAYAADTSLEEGAFRRHVLFDPVEKLIRRHMVTDQDGRIMVDVRYDDYAPVSDGAPDSCRLPGLISIHANNGALMELILGDWLYDASFSAEDFQVNLPPGFTLVPVD